MTDLNQHKIMYFSHKHSLTGQKTQSDLSRAKNDFKVREISSFQNNSSEDENPETKHQAMNSMKQRETKQIIKSTIIQNENRDEQIQIVKNLDQKTFTLNKKGYLMYYKGIHVLKQIVDGIQSEGLLNLDVSLYTEFMFLITLRSYNYLNKARSLLSQNPHPCIQKDVESLFMFETKAKSKLFSYIELLDLEERKFFSRLRNFKERFYISDKNKQKYTFLDGIEGLDYSINQQIQFTYHNYIQTVLNSPQIRSKHSINEQLRRALRSYKLICQIQEQEIQNEGSFEELKEKILLDQ